MAWPEKLKLNKQLTRSVIEAGYDSPRNVQQQILPRIFGGQDVIAIAPEGCGKTTTYILGVLNRLKHNPDGVPHVLVLVPTKEQVLAVIEQFESLNKNKSVLFAGLFAAPGIESQMNALADGADIVVATPDRARSIYLKLGLNLNKIDLFIVDDADQIVKQGLQLPVAELANSITKCQHLVFTEVIHERLNKMIAPFMKQPAVIEIDELEKSASETIPVYPQVLYQVPDFGTKLNLLNLFMQDEELFSKVVIFVNTSHTAEKVGKNLQNRLKDAVSILNPATAGSLTDFKTSIQARALIVSNENNLALNLEDIPILLHFELPVEKETFINRILDQKGTSGEETICITFTTDLELNMVKKIEQVIGQKIPLARLPEGLIIAKQEKNPPGEEKKTSKKEPQLKAAGEAFHEKKASNSKTYNYSSGVKAKMNKRKNTGKLIGERRKLKVNK